MQNYKIALNPSENGSFNWETVFDCAAKTAEIKSIENQMAAANFWDNSENAQQVVGQLKSLKAIYDPWNDAEAASEDLTVLIEMADEDPDVEKEVADEVERLEKLLEALELKSLLDGPHDAAGAILTIQARDGATRDELIAVADAAMATSAPPPSTN